jgi:hypothetical protein
LVTEPTTEIIDVEDEQGNQTTQTLYEGGEIVIGQNERIFVGKTIYFKVVDNVYE